MRHPNEINTERPVPWGRVALILPDLPKETQAVLAFSQDQDAAEAADRNATWAETERLKQQLAVATVKVSQAHEALADGNAARHKDELQKRLRAAEHERDTIAKRIGKVKPCPRRERMHTSRIGAAIAAIRKPQRIAAFKLEARFAKLPTLDAIDLAKSELAARFDRHRHLTHGYVSLEEAQQNYNAAASRLARKSTRVPFLDFARVTEGVDGRLKTESPDLPPEILIEACMGFLRAYGEKRLREMYEKLEARSEFDEGGVEILSMAERKAERARIEGEIAELHKVLGYLTRQAIVEGHDIAIDPSLPVKALLGLEDDPDAPVVEPKPQFMELAEHDPNFGTRASF